jgi:(p)ppGpp synthase/HD superfamily hydrolase
MNEIETRHVKQLAVMRGWLDGKGYYKALDALEFCRAFELGYRKDNRTPKFHHQLSIVRLLSTLAPHLANPEDTLTAAFLHDILEDHSVQVNLGMLEARFGKTVADAVWKLSKKMGGLVKSYDLYFAEMATCPIASLVKMSDRIHNVQTMVGVFTPEKQAKYVQEVEVYFYPLCKQARRNFPRQYGAYENLKILLRCQVALVKAFVDSDAAHQGIQPLDV